MSGPNLTKSIDSKATKQQPRHSSVQAPSAATPSLESSVLEIHQTAGNRAASRLFQSGGQFSDQAVGLQTLAGELEKPRPVANNANLFEIQLDAKVIQVTQQELESIRTQFREMLNTGIQRVLKGPIESGRFKHEDASKLREEQKIVASISSGVGRVFGGEGFPEFAIWDGPINALAQARSALNNNKLSEAASNLIDAEHAALKADRQVTAYQKGTMAGAEASQITLEIVRDVSLGISSTLATIATGGAAGAVIGTGITAATNLAQQASETSIGLRKEIDFAGVAFETIIDAIISKFLGKLGDKIFAKLVKKPEFATRGQRITARAIVDLLESTADTTLNSTAKALFNNFRDAKRKVSMEEFLDNLGDQLLNPQSILMNMLTGQISAAIENKLASKLGPPRPSGRAPKSESDAAVFTKQETVVVHPTQTSSTIHQEASKVIESSGARATSAKNYKKRPEVEQATAMGFLPTEAELEKPYGKKPEVFTSATAKKSSALKTSILPDIAESQAYNVALSNKEIGLQRSTGANVPGPDFITAVRGIGNQIEIIVTDVYTPTISPQIKKGVQKPSTISSSWHSEIEQAIAPGRLNLGDPALEAEIRSAFKAGRIRRRQVSIDLTSTGQGKISGL